MISRLSFFSRTSKMFRISFDCQFVCYLPTKLNKTSKKTRSNGPGRRSHYQMILSPNLLLTPYLGGVISLFIIVFMHCHYTLHVFTMPYIYIAWFSLYTILYTIHYLSSIFFHSVYKVVSQLTDKQCSLERCTVLWSKTEFIDIDR